MTAPLGASSSARPAPTSRAGASTAGEPSRTPARSLREHEAFGRARGGGRRGRRRRGRSRQKPDAIYVFDPALVTDAGRSCSGRERRRGATKSRRSDRPRAAGVPIAAELTAPALAEGGDTFWLDESTLVVGLGYRTNEAGAAQLAVALPGVEVFTSTCRTTTDASEVLHLLSLISPLDEDLARRLPAADARSAGGAASRSAGSNSSRSPTRSSTSMGCNVLALGAASRRSRSTATPRPAGAWKPPGVDVRVYPGEELSRKGDGGPPALRFRSHAAEHELDRLLGRRGPLDAFQLPTRLEDDDRPPEPHRKRDLRQRPPGCRRPRSRRLPTPRRRSSACARARSRPRGRPTRSRRRGSHPGECRSSCLQPPSPRVPPRPSPRRARRSRPCSRARRAAGRPLRHAPRARSRCRSPKPGSRRDGRSPARSRRDARPRRRLRRLVRRPAAR